MADADEGVKRIYERCVPQVLRYMRPTAKFVTTGRREMVIEQIPGTTKWRARFWRAGVGKLPTEIDTSFTSYRDAENALIQYLRRTDKWGYAVWPGKEYKQRGPRNS
jgi:hypothetical protein